ncbi:MAG: tRNA pseudouridine(55) synthase TruB [Synergistaceae bacterium]|jgi:tRNA pseudouridine(55) synthase|nr:tRNA pseudouridine(55) synthase TruB [Synergistaceae bacterium]
MPDGLLLIDKPDGLRSADCVARVRRRFGKNTRVGHAGTLDSTASGLLVVLLGSATRLSDYVMKLPKTYEAAVHLGKATDTCDRSGQVVFCGDATKVDETSFDSALCSFWGERMQLPPEISALKLNGRPSHRIAREGGDARPARRPVLVTSLSRGTPISEGRVKISVTCGKGTYIRSIVRDIGLTLGCGAHVAELRRLSTGPFRVEDALMPDLSGGEFFGRGVPGRKIEDCLRSPREIGPAFHRVLLSRDAERRLMSGLCVPLADAGRYVPGFVELSGGLCVEGENMIGFADVVPCPASEKNGKGTGLESEKSVPCLKPRANIAVRRDGAPEISQEGVIR